MSTLAGRLYSKTIVLQGDPTSAPVNNGGPVPTPVMTSVAPRPVQRGQVILGAAGADIYFAGPLICTPVPQRTRTAPSIILRQLQDGAIVPAGGQVPSCMVVTRPVAPRALTKPVALVNPPFQAPFAAAPPALLVRRVPPVGRVPRRVFVRTYFPAAPVVPGTAPDVETPTGLVLDAHETGLTLAAHQMGVLLDAHEAGLTLNAHQMGLILDKGDTLATPVFYTGDTWEPISGVVVDANGDPVDISTADSIRMIAKIASGSTVITDSVGGGVTTSDDNGTTPLRGAWHYTWADDGSDLTVAGSYVPEIEVTWDVAGTQIQTFRTDNESFLVKADND